jgi:hypothetical protein
VTSHIHVCFFSHCLLQCPITQHSVQTILTHSLTKCPLLFAFNKPDDNSLSLYYYNHSQLFGPKRDEIIGEWRKLHNEELHDLYSSPTLVRVIKSRRMRWVGHVAQMRRGEVCTGFWWGNEGKRPLGRPRCKWKDNNKVDLQELGCGSMDWIELAQDTDRWRALMNAVMNVQVP